MMEYKGYIGKVEIDEEAGILYGEVINVRDVITFEGTTVDEVQKAFRESIDNYLEFCAQRGESPEKPFRASSLSGCLPNCIVKPMSRQNWQIKA